jgi:hypothetical protein
MQTPLGAIFLGSEHHTISLRRFEMVPCEGQRPFVTCFVMLPRSSVDDLGRSPIACTSKGCLLRLQGQICEVG